MKTLFRTYLLVFTTLTFLQIQSWAQDASGKEKMIQTFAPGKSSPLKLLLGVNFEFGGDDVVRIFFTDGSEQTIQAGQGGTFYAGGELQLSKKELLFLRSYLGIKYVTTKATNAHIRLTRIPWNTLLHVQPAKHFRIGAGLATHNAISFRGDGIAPDFKMKSVPGPILEISVYGISLSYTLMTYKDDGNQSYNANAFGIGFSGTLGGNRRR